MSIGDFKKEWNSVASCGSCPDSASRLYFNRATCGSSRKLLKTTRRQTRLETFYMRGWWNLSKIRSAREANSRRKATSGQHFQSNWAILQANRQRLSVINRSQQLLLITVLLGLLTLWLPSAGGSPTAWQRERSAGAERHKPLIARTLPQQAAVKGDRRSRSAGLAP